MTAEDMTERDLAEYYDNHRGDTTIWQPEAVEARTPRRGGPSIVISIRFNRAELRQLKQSAADTAVTLSDFIRQAALERASTTTIAVRTRMFPAVTMLPQLVLFTQTSSISPVPGSERRSA